MSSFLEKATSSMPSEFAHAMRSAELALAMTLLPPGARVLELGAGDGWQASILEQHGFLVKAVDIADPTTCDTQYAHVVTYDGKTIPFPDGSFDAVFSSNVLEHVKDFDCTQAELARILTNEGIAVHCVPSSIWRIWTTLGHPLYAIRWLRNLHRRDLTATTQSAARLASAKSSRGGVLRLLRLGLIAPKHGESGNLMSEHLLFSRRTWKRRFEQSGWIVVSEHPTNLFYSGNEIFGLRLAGRTRNMLAKVLGSSTRIFVLKPAHMDSSPLHALAGTEPSCTSRHSPNHKT